MKKNHDSIELKHEFLNINIGTQELRCFKTLKFKQLCSLINISRFGLRSAFMC